MKLHRIPLIGLLLLGGCGVPQEQGQKMMNDIAKLQQRSQMFDEQAAKLQKATSEAEMELGRLRKLVDEGQNAIKSSADLGLSVEKLKVDLATITGRLDDLQTSMTALNKSFTDYRAQSDIKIEQVVNATTNQKAPPIPENADGVYSQAQQRFNDKSWVDARRLWEAFLARYPQDARAPKAQFMIGESYLAETRYANAIGAFTKLIDNFPKSELVPDAMFKNGTAFYALKYCGDARIYFQELLRRYPKTEWKRDANEQLKKLQRDLKNKAVCQS
ncbi:MAG TPA: outer membrane protein assembly factor BamD [Polyangia bacterium]|jgi:tol-pal system protein YbgF|nr:outer membrane protein assembly factor BamD [Polyangia bacterium]